MAEFLIVIDSYHRLRQTYGHHLMLHFEEKSMANDCRYDRKEMELIDV